MSFTLLLGGVRSGKSRLAVELAARSGRPVVFIATAEAFDDEMAMRIERHRAERPAGWTTREEPHAVVAAVEGVDPSHVVVVDCITVWVANRCLAGTADDRVVAEAEELAAVLARREGPGIVVTNEVGMGVHPATDLGRRYRDLLGAVNVRLAAASARTALVMAGKALLLGGTELLT